MEISLKTSIQLNLNLKLHNSQSNLNLKLHNSQSTIFGLCRLSLQQENFCRDFRCESYYFYNLNNISFQKDTDKYMIHFIKGMTISNVHVYLGQPKIS